jgi:uncharacterized protein (TIGR03790 family)
MKLFMLLLFFLLFPIAGRALDSHDVMLVANAQSPGSMAVAEKYCAVHAIATHRILRLSLPVTHTVSQNVYRAEIEAPVLRAAKHQKAKVIILCYGMPWRIVDDGPSPRQNPFTSSWASVDSELASNGHAGSRGYATVPNPYFGKQSPFNRTDMYLVARLDGPNAAAAIELITRAQVKPGHPFKALIDLQPEVNGSSGKNVYAFNAHLTRAALYLRQAGIPTHLDTSQELAPAPSDPLQFYWGWYADPNGNFTTNTYKNYRWAPGAVAVHTCSFGARNLRRKQSAAAGLITAGATATIGTVNEPLIGGWSRPDMFFKNYVKPKNTGLTFIESACAATPFLSWQTVFIGDPLLRFSHQ